MPIDINHYIASGKPSLYAGPILFRQGRVDTPLLSMIGSRRRTTNSELFIIGQHYSAPKPGDSVVSENEAAKKVPDFSPIGRNQDTNITQIHTKSIAWTDYSTGNRGMLNGGPNLSGQTGNPINEVDFQRANKVLELAQDIEYAILNSQYQFRNGDNNTANRTRGLLEAVQSNVMDIGGNELSWNHLNELLFCMADNGAPTQGLILGCDEVTASQLAVEAKSEHFEVVTGLSSISGIAMTEIHTLRGVVRIVCLRHLPQGTALLLNLGALSIVEQPFQNGNWTWFSIGRQAASEVEMLAGAWGLDYGYEGLHAKLTNIATGYTPYKGTKVFISNAAVSTVDASPSLTGATLASAQVGVETAALTLDYTGEPASEATLTYQWQSGKFAIGIFKDIEGATEAAYTPAAEDEGMFIRCVVTASGSAEGTVTSNSRKVTAAE